MFNPRTKYWWPLSITLLILGAIWTWFSAIPPDSPNAQAVSAPQAGFMAPDFALEAIDGQLFVLSELHGNPVVINLWASWCAPCRAEMPAIERVHQDYQEKGLIILAVNATNQDSVVAAKTFVAEHDLSFPILLDHDGTVSDRYHLSALPTTFFVDRNGFIQEVVIGGPMAEALLRVRIEALFEEVP